MAIPKKNIDLILKKQLNSERVSLIERIRQNESFLPKGVLHEDLDRGFVDFVNKNISLNINGVKVPVIFLSIQSWNEFTKTWQFSDKYKNIQMPFITIVRNTDVILSEDMKYNIPYLYKKPIVKVPMWNGNRNGYDIYEIPQPIRIDIQYEVRLFSTRLRELNEFNKIVLTEFSSAQAYSDVNGHYIPITLTDIDDEHEINDINKKRFYVQKYNFTQHGFLLDEDEFQIKPAVTRTLLNYKFLGERNKKGKPSVLVNKFNDGNVEIVIEFFIGSPFNVSFIADGNYTIKGINNKNIDNYIITKNSNIVYPTFSVTTGDLIEISVNQLNSEENSIITLFGSYDINTGMDNLITDPSTEIQTFVFEKRTTYDLLFEPNTVELIFTNQHEGILHSVTKIKNDITSYSIYKNNVLVTLPTAVNIGDIIKTTIMRIDVSSPSYLTMIQVFNNTTVTVQG